MKASRSKARSQEQRKWIETLQVNNYFRPTKRARKPRHEPVPTVAPEIIESDEQEKMVPCLRLPNVLGQNLSSVSRPRS